MAKVQKKSKTSDSSSEQQEPLVIDKAKNLIFKTEEEVFQHFQDQLTVLEHEYENLRTKEDYPEDYVENFEDVLGEVFEHPDEVWRDEERFEGIPIYTYLKKFPDEALTYVVLAYLDESIPTFIFMHFPTKDDKLLEAYRRTECVFHVDRMAGSGDALSEGDELALGLFKAMITVRSETDIPESEFPSYLQYRDETVETADEIWRNTDLSGNILVSFIKHFDLDDQEFDYITVTMEDNFSETHYVLFSFPSKDKNLVDRYRHGETLHTEQVVQEDSH
jgi:hypothetical protein